MRGVVDEPELGACGGAAAGVLAALPLLAEAEPALSDAPGPPPPLAPAGGADVKSVWPVGGITPEEPPPDELAPDELEPEELLPDDDPGGPAPGGAFGELPPHAPDARAAERSRIRKSAARNGSGR